MSSGVGVAVLPSQVNFSSSSLMISRVSRSITRVILSITSWLTFEASLFETKITLLSEWLIMFVTSFSELSGRIGIEILPNDTVAKKATDQLGILCENIATLSPTPIPYWVSVLESASHLFLKEAKV